LKDVGLKVKTQSKKVNKSWLNDHVNDPYVKLAQKEGYRARAAYKLKEINETLPNNPTWDGSGGFRQCAWRMEPILTALYGTFGSSCGELDGTLIALDILPMEPIEGVQFLQGDFREPEIRSPTQCLAC
jgi:23S rRNA (uridine2552-2'-O)-methyltransferase